MASKSEAGHSVNLANHEKLLTNLTSFGTAYNPSKPDLKLEALFAQQTDSKSATTSVNAAESLKKNAISERVDFFIELDKLVTRSNNALKASDSNIKLDENARTLVRKLMGRRSKPKKTEEEKKAAIVDGKPIIEKSASQRDFDSRIGNYDKYISLLTSIKAYNPNEEDLKISSLQTFNKNLIAKNSAAIQANIAVKKAKNLRDKVMYSVNTGLVDTTVDVKNYVKSVFGASSPEYKSISGLKFINYR